MVGMHWTMGRCQSQYRAVDVHVLLSGSVGRGKDWIWRNLGRHITDIWMQIRCCSSQMWLLINNSSSCFRYREHTSLASIRSYLVIVLLLCDGSVQWCNENLKQELILQSAVLVYFFGVAEGCNIGPLIFMMIKNDLNWCWRRLHWGDYNLY